MKKVNLKLISILLISGIYNLGYSQTAWDTQGNSIGATDWLGSDNNFPLNFRTNNTPRFSITADGALLYNSTTGGIPTTGNGTRMMWIPDLKAFRAGGITGGNTAWNTGNIGEYSVAFDFNS